MINKIQVLKHKMVRGIKLQQGPNNTTNSCDMFKPILVNIDSNAALIAIIIN